MAENRFDVAVIGGGLGGLVSANLLAQKGIKVCLLERKTYPFHRVCGEYVSNEVTQFLKVHNLFPTNFNPPQINTFNLTSINGRLASAKLQLGGFGVSRYSFDAFLAEAVQKNGGKVYQETMVDDVKFNENEFQISTHSGTQFSAEVAVGSFGKRSNLDRKLNRKFLTRSSPYLGVKYHIKYDVPENEISLHNFQGGYCGISRVEDGKVNLCYLSERENLKGAENIPDMEEKVLHKNPFLKKIWTEAEFLFDEAIVINEINFESKGPIEKQILMVGDSAGMITPLCGNGMAIAIHSAKIAAEEIVAYFNSKARSRVNLNSRYSQRWYKHFSTRLKVGRNLQKLFGSVWLSNISVNLLKQASPIGRFLISKTHGKPI